MGSDTDRGNPGEGISLEKGVRKASMEGFTMILRK